MRRIIAVVSCKGGVGKTQTVINLAFAINELKYKVTMVDADISAPKLSLQLNYFSFPVTLQDVLLRGVHTLHATYRFPNGVRIVPASIGLEQATINSNINTKNLGQALRMLDGLVLVDCPPGLGENVMDVLDACDEILVVTTPETGAVIDGLKIIEMARRRVKDIGGIILNRVRNDSYELRVNEIEPICNVPVVSVIPEDPNMRKSSFEKVPLVVYNPYSPASLAYKKLAAELVGETYEKPKFASLKRIRRIWRFRS